MKKKPKIGRPRKGSKVREVVSIRLEPWIKDRLIKHNGSVQAWIDSMLGRREGTDKWKWIDEDGYPNRNLVDEDGEVILSLYESHGGGIRASDENEELIASAPQLKEALIELIDLMEDVRSGNYKPDSFTCQPAKALVGYGKF
jgi:hypothetical protein